MPRDHALRPRIGGQGRLHRLDRMTHASHDHRASPWPDNSKPLGLPARLRHQFVHVESVLLQCVANRGVVSSIRVAVPHFQPERVLTARSITLADSDLEPLGSPGDE